MKTSLDGVNKIKVFEGKVLTQDGKHKAYRDSVGVLTIGYGHTGPDVKSGMTIDEQQATRLLQSDLAEAEGEVNRSIKVPLAQHQFDALVSLTFNIGNAAFRGSTLVRLLNQRRYDAVPAQFMRWNRGTVNGRKVEIPGLTVRRRAEAAMWRGPSVTTAQPASRSETPLVEAAPAQTSNTGQGATAAIVGTAGAGVTALQVARDYREITSTVSGIVGIGLGCVVLLGAAYVVWARWNEAGRPLPWRKAS